MKKVRIVLVDGIVEEIDMPEGVEVFIVDVDSDTEGVEGYEPEEGNGYPVWETRHWRGDDLKMNQTLVSERMSR